MNLIQLKLFNEIARELSFVKVAKLNHISQPAVSVHIKKLEHALGQQLLSRTSQTTQLTPEGLLILDDVKEILRLCENIKVRSNYHHGVVEGHVRVAAIHSVGMYEIGGFLTSFMNAYPNIRVHLEYRHSEDIYQNIEKGKIDIGIVAYPQVRPKIEALPYSQDQLVLITGTKHRLAHKKSVALNQIAGEAFIAFGEGIPTRVAIDKLLQEYGVDVDIRMTHNNVYTLKKAVEAEVGIAIVPSATVGEEVERGALKRIKLNVEDTKRPISVIRLAGRKGSAPVNLFVERLLAFSANEKAPYRGLVL
ncbi:LysR family transcriptional regulator [Enterovibrio sp. ZSDZ35]|uniref:LysR family transcriptional regulator n=1 Tax=Enterovibrio qingdaonensis TaxID=2899818 RepID=A0ABT5QLE6_9GAMM|nr:LysR family transcriptional regulator [Enterovibrio sp. ZSDZ35]MDD1781809.1 LysR family transcriptional regulator [Enterovibrio sp. ZSDZ35]